MHYHNAVLTEPSLKLGSSRAGLSQLQQLTGVAIQAGFTEGRFTSNGSLHAQTFGFSMWIKFV
jgi:hypothetical protein